MPVVRRADVTWGQCELNHQPAQSTNHIISVILLREGERKKEQRITLSGDTQGQSN
jgi:hypothetical protein